MSCAHSIIARKGWLFPVLLYAGYEAAMVIGMGFAVGACVQPRDGRRLVPLRGHVTRARHDCEADNDDEHAA